MYEFVCINLYTLICIFKIYGIFFIQSLFGTIHKKYFFFVTKYPVKNCNKKEKSGHNESKIPSPKKDKEVKERHKIINLDHPDAAETPTDGRSRISIMLGNISKL
jgi:hypothetical protein